MPNVTIVCYSSTSNTRAIATAVEQGAGAAGAQTRLRKVRELAGVDAIATKSAWRAHLESIEDVPEATSDDLALRTAASVPTSLPKGTDATAHVQDIGAMPRGAHQTGHAFHAHPRLTK